jgi:hypothetical protein
MGLLVFDLQVMAFTAEVTLGIDKRALPAIAFPHDAPHLSGNIA